MGGGIALDYAITHPLELRSLTLIDSAMGGWTGWSPGFVPTIFLRDVAERGGVDAARAAWIGHPFFAPASERPDVAARLRAMADAYSGWHWLHTDGSEEPDPRLLAAMPLAILSKRACASRCGLTTAARTRRDASRFEISRDSPGAARRAMTQAMGSSAIPLFARRSAVPWTDLGGHAGQRDAAGSCWVGFR